MGIELGLVKERATLEEIRIRVGHALQRHPLCRNVQFDIMSVPRTARGGNWTISLHSVEPAALWEASDIVADIQAAYDLLTPAELSSAA
ncbi:conserved hypothetical protein [Bradyrhizobium sp. ORS 375]|uniref:hypothetical protein n=1 Tax=Bradyrhizobium sp. (strain ORS 375) TaxID=566679 RepID=UPI000240A78E|nr:hypothetical protein [Bradyrhizobium sp. ORS 375]CCD94062.1 conserved hypothetical protein [Bradyrhizobium sp. ORS 375]